MNTSTASNTGKATSSDAEPLDPGETFARTLRDHPGFPEPHDSPDGFATRAVAGQLTPGDRAWVGSDAGRRWLSIDLRYFITTGQQPPTSAPPFAAPNMAWEEPEDRSTATLSALGAVQYVEDIVRPGRIVVIAAEEGTGKSFAFQGELALRLAVAGGQFAETWDVLQNGPVLIISEMPGDEDYAREELIMDSLGITRDELVGRYFRQDLNTAALGAQVLDSDAWRQNFIPWAKEHELIALFIDPATSATDADAWGKELRATFRQLRLIQKELPQLVIFLAVHLKKPSGRGGSTTRGLHEVMGEYGRLNDVTILMQNDGANLDSLILTVRKRVQHQRRLRLTKRDGLLVDPQAIDDAPQPKVGLEQVREVIKENPGISYGDLGKALGVSRSTAGTYVEQLVQRGQVTIQAGPRRSNLVYDILHVPANAA